MTMDAMFRQVLTGQDQMPMSAVKEAVAQRMAAILLTIDEKEGYHLYGGHRCQPENLGWRFIQSYGEPDPQEILDGKWDAQIEANYHDAASAEYYYRYEKDWG